MVYRCIRCTGCTGYPRLSDLNAIIGKNFIDHAFQAQRVRSRQATNLASVLKNYKRWNGCNTKLEWNALVLVNIHFGKANFSQVFVAQLLINRCNSTARSTPGSPEI